MTDQELLDLVNAQIAALLNGGAVKAWKEGGHAVEHMSLSELMKTRNQLEQQIAQQSTGILLPVREVDI